MKRKHILDSSLLILVFLVAIGGCGSKEETKETKEAVTSTEKTAEAAEESTDGEVDAVTTASIVDTAQGFLTAAGEEGTWIIAITRDVTIDKEIVLDGRFVHRDEIYRKLALYAQDEDRNITARYTLTAPKMVVRSENARIQGGTFAGDVYVEANKFHIYDGMVDGDIYFAREEYKSSFTLQEGGEVTGELKLQ